METILDQGFVDQQERQVKYAGFGPRLGAQIIDNIVLVPLSLAAIWINLITVKSPWIFLGLSLVAQAYKPVMEAVYGASLGKMALDIRIVNLRYEKAGLEAILLRNAPYLIPSIISSLFTVALFFRPEFERIDNVFEFSTLSSAGLAATILNWFMYVFTIVDLIVFFSNNQSRSLHDKIAGTVVIHTK